MLTNLHIECDRQLNKFYNLLPDPFSLLLIILLIKGKNTNNTSKPRSAEEKFLQASTAHQQAIQQHIQPEDEEDDEEEDIADDIINTVFKSYSSMTSESVVTYGQHHCNSLCLSLEAFDDCTVTVISLSH